MKRILCLFLCVCLYVSMMVFPVGAATQSHTDTLEPSAVIAICFGIGLAVGLITVGVMTSQLKSVRHQYGADSYTDAGSLDVTCAKDVYLYRTVTRTERPKNSKK